MINLNRYNELLMKKFTDSHEWIEINNDIVIVGITDYAQQELGSIVYVQLPHIGSTFIAGETAVVLESTKAAIDIPTPIAGEIVNINHDLINFPQNINQDAEKNGWLFQLKIHFPKELECLMDAVAYHKLIAK